MKNRIIGLVSIIIALLMIVSMFSATFSSTSSSSGFQGFNVTAPITKANVTLTGDVAKDFAGHLVDHNTVRSLWTAGNNISDLYLTYNSTCLFVGLNESIDIQGTEGYFIFYNNPSRALFDLCASESNKVKATFENLGLEYYIGFGNLSDLMTKYSILTGKAMLPPKWSLGFHQSRFIHIMPEA